MTISSTRRPRQSCHPVRKKFLRPDSNQHRMHASAFLAEKMDQLFQSYNRLGQGEGPEEGNGPSVIKTCENDGWNYWGGKRRKAGSTFWIECRRLRADLFEVENGLAHLLDRLYLTNYQQFRVRAILPPEI